MEVDGKKITVKFFLNQDVKGRRITLHNTTLKYPLYVRITYDRKTTRYAIPNNWFSMSEEASIETIPEFQTYKSVIGKIVSYEVNKKGEKFEIKGLGERMKTYLSRLLPGLEALLHMELDSVMEKILTYSEYTEWQNKPLSQKVIEALEKLDDNIPDSLRIKIVNTSFFSHNNNSGKIAIYQWLLPGYRGEFTKDFDETIDKIISGAQKKLVAYGKIELNESNDYKYAIDRIITACEELLELGYTEYYDMGGVKIRYQ